MSPLPPRLATRLLERRLPSPVREFLLGDMHEGYQARHAAGGALRADSWYWWQALAAAARRWPTEEGSRRASGWAGLGRDLAHGVRVARRAPLFAGLVVLTFALGLGAAGAIFSVLQPVLLSGAPYPDSDRLVLLRDADPDRHPHIGYQTYADLRQQLTGVERMAALAYWAPTLGGAGQEPERPLAMRVTHDFFRTLAVTPALGHDFSAEEDLPGTRNSVVILTHELWQRRYAGDSAIIGRPILVNDQAATVIGVLPATFENMLLPTAQLFAPLGYAEGEPQACRNCRHLRVIARRKAGTTEAALDGELARIGAVFSREYPDTYAPGYLGATPLNQWLTRGSRPVLLAITGAVALLLLIACLNVTNLFLGRAIKRRGEFAVRSALGAGAMPLVRQVVAEAVVLALAGGALGVLLAFAGTKLLVGLAPGDVPRLGQVRVNGGVMLFTLLLASLTGIVAGATPALAARRANIAGLLRDGGRSIIGRLGRRVRAGLVVLEVSVALLLLTGAGLLTRSLGKLLEVTPGFDPEGVVTFELQTYGPRYADDAPVHHFYQQVVDEVRALPGVTGAAVVSQLPLSSDYDTWGIRLEQPTAQAGQPDPNTFRFAVSPEYLETMQIPLLKGRGFTPADNAGAPPVVLINDAIARQLFPGRDPIGQRIQLGGTDSPFREIVGVVAAVHHQGLDVGAESQIYLPETQNPFADSRMVLVVRGRAAATTLVPAVRQAIHQVDPTVPIATVATMTDYLQRHAATRRFALAVFQWFAIGALLLAALGLYGVLAASVAERTREIGIRSALGAPRRSLLLLVGRFALGMTAAGVGIGLAGALFGSRLLGSLLYGVQPTDHLTLAVAGAVLLLTAGAAAAVPAWRAMRVEPVVALREE